MEHKNMFIIQQKHSKEGPVLNFFPSYKALWENTYEENFVMVLDFTPPPKNKSNNKEI